MWWSFVEHESKLECVHTCVVLCITDTACMNLPMLFYYTDQEMMTILIRDFEARYLEQYFNFTLPRNPTISGHTVMIALRAHFRSQNDYQLLGMFVAALRQQKIQNRSAQIENFLKVICPCKVYTSYKKHFPKMLKDVRMAQYQKPQKLGARMAVYRQERL